MVISVLTLNCYTLPSPYHLFSLKGLFPLFNQNKYYICLVLHRPSGICAAPAGEPNSELRGTWTPITLKHVIYPEKNQ